MSIKEFADKWCFFICQPTENKCLSPVFEFNLYKEFNSRSNFRLFIEDNSIIARCYGKFNTGKRYKNDLKGLSQSEKFYNYITSNFSNIRGGKDEREEYYVELFRLNQLEFDIIEFVNSLAKFGLVVSAYKIND